MKLTQTVSALMVLAAFSCCWAVPIVSNVRMQQIEGTKDVRITYDLADNVNTQLWISVSARPMTNIVNWGTEYFPMSSVEGDVRRWVAPGLGKEIIWHAGTDWNGRFTDTAKATVQATAKIRNEYRICSDENLKFTTGGYGTWSTYTDSGVYCIRSSGRQSYATLLQTTVQGAGTISFRWKLSHGSYQSWQLMVDGVGVQSRSGGSGWYSVSYAITQSGPHTITWSYQKSTSDASYYAYLTDVAWK